MIQKLIIFVEITKTLYLLLGVFKYYRITILEVGTMRTYYTELI